MIEIYTDGASSGNPGPLKVKSLAITGSRRLSLPASQKIISATRLPSA
jgi:hypothetical protein